MDNVKWKLFGLVEQEKKSLTLVSELTNLSIPEIKAKMAEIKKEQPELFFVDSERQALSRQICGQEQKRRNTYIVSHDTVTEADPDYVTQHHRKKF